MKKFLLCAILLPLAALAQDNFIAVGVKYDSGYIPQFAYGRKLSNSGLFSYSSFSATNIRYKPLDISKLQVQTETGLALCAISAGPFKVCPTVQGGLVQNGEATGYTVGSGGFVSFDIPNTKFFVIAGARYQKTNLDGVVALTPIQFGVGWKF